MTVRRIPVVFECGGEQLVGVITAPESSPRAAPEVGMLIIVGGPQYRVGSHRQFVQIAERAAAEGFAALRFDVRGMGDAGGRQRDFEEIEDDIAAAIDALQSAVPSVRRVGVWGLCGGASAALLYCRSRRDPRVEGLALVNPWVRSATTQARTRVKYYYVQRLMQREFWHKLLSGRVTFSAVSELFGAIRVAVSRVDAEATVASENALTLERRMLQGLAGFNGEVLLILSGNDYTAKEFLETVRLETGWHDHLLQPNVRRIDLQEADHTFSQPQAQSEVEIASVSWLIRLQLIHGHEQSPAATQVHHA